MQGLPKFGFSLTKIAKIHTLSLTRVVKSYIVGQTEVQQKHFLANGTSPGTFTTEELPIVAFSENQRYRWENPFWLAICNVHVSWNDSQSYYW